MTLLEFANEHPIVALLIAWALLATVRYVVLIVASAIRGVPIVVKREDDDV